MNMVDFYKQNLFLKTDHDLPFVHVCVGPEVFFVIGLPTEAFTLQWDESISLNTLSTWKKHAKTGNFIFYFLSFFYISQDNIICCSAFGRGCPTNSSIWCVFNHYFIDYNQILAILLAKANNDLNYENLIKARTNALKSCMKCLIYLFKIMA